MKFIHQSELDKTRWDNLVKLHKADIFSFSWFLDSCSEDWYVLVDNDFKNGIPLPFNKKLGIQTLSPPIFIRNLDAIGDDPGFAARALPEIQKRFVAGHLQVAKKTDDTFSRIRVYQSISEKQVLHTQAKRMLQKSVKNGISIEKTADWRGVLSIIRSELSEKISEFTAQNLQRLENLIISLEREKRMHCYGIYMSGKLEGGMIFMDSETKYIYLKGAANPEAKKAGGMYLCMHDFIDKTLEENKLFDFGGSEVEGVRRFNQNLGGADSQYYVYEWNRAPFWFNFIKRVYHQLKNRS